MEQTSPVIQLRPVDEIEESNETFPLEQAQERYPAHETVSKGQFFPYNHLYKDDNWGCAWRAIQLVLSAQSIATDFRELFHKFSRKKILSQILQTKLPKLDIREVRETKFAPEENQSNWAEPFIAQLICESYMLKTKLFLVNGCPKCYAPEEVFEECVSFEGFWQIIKRVIPDSPIMIDDGQLALSIIGYRENEGNKKCLILADPHIYSNRKERATGIYEVVLDEHGGKIEVVMSASQQKSMRRSFEQIHFASKKWMAMYAEANIN